LERYLKRKIEVDFREWRPGDQRVYISNIREAENTLNWTPRTPVKEGISKLISWVNENRNLIL